MTEKRKTYTSPEVRHKWNSANYAKVTYDIDKDLLEQFRDTASRQGDSMRGIVVTAIKDYVTKNSDNK